MTSVLLFLFYYFWLRFYMLPWAMGRQWLSRIDGFIWRGTRSDETNGPDAESFCSLTSFIQFYRGKHFIWKIFLPFAIASIPMSFIGGLVVVDAMVYKKYWGTSSDSIIRSSSLVILI